MSRNDKLPGEYHIQQFPNAHMYLHDEHTRPMWWEVPTSEKKYASGGSVISRMRKKPARHPALDIPGVHIRTAEAGEPIFHGEK
jgi:hypothetical protein